jgi:4-amino-4-deoxy-L-arabinose transferase-like glycosyltransferase
MSTISAQEASIEGSRKTFVQVAAITALGLVLRLVVAFNFTRISPDAVEYGRIARNVLAGHGFSMATTAPFVPATIRDPLFPYSLTVSFFLGGVTLALVVQVLLSASNIPVIYLLGRKFFDRRVGLAAAIICAVYLPAFVFVRDLLTEVMASLLLSVMLLLLARSGARVNAWAAAAGLVGGFLVLTRSETVIYLAGIGAFVLCRRDRWPAAKAVALAGAVVALVVAPWMVRNFLVTGRIQLRDRAAGLAALSIGTGRSFDDPLYMKAFSRNGGPLTNSELAVYRKEVVATYVADVQAAPVSFLRFRSYNFLRTWLSGGIEELFPSVYGDQLRRLSVNAIARVVADSLFGLAFCLGGLVAVWRLWRIRSGALILAVVPAMTMLVTLPMFSSLRYSVMSRVVLIPLVASVTVAWFKNPRSSGGGKILPEVRRSFDSQGDSSAARTAFGFQGRTSLAEGIRRTAEWFR